ncbi:MAG: prepilin-type N-terminal cleavage/methylation domain-containing protein [Phycisphaeraceae bacterium]
MKHPRCINHRRVRRGFTLIEVILAISLAVGLFGSALWFYQYSASVRDNISWEMQQIIARRQMMDRMTNDLRSAVAAPGGMTLEGTADRMTFIAAKLPGKSMWAVQSITENPLPPDPDLHRVSYGLTIVENENHEMIVIGIDTQSQRLLTAQVVEENKGLTTTLLSQEMRFIWFQYWDGSQWVPEWTEQPVLPLAVQITLGNEPLPEGSNPQEYPFETWRRVVFLPGGQPVQQGTAIQGLGAGGGP